MFDRTHKANVINNLGDSVVLPNPAGGGAEHGFGGGVDGRGDLGSVVCAAQFTWNSGQDDLRAGVANGLHELGIPHVETRAAEKQ